MAHDIYKAIREQYSENDIRKKEQNYSYRLANSTEQDPSWQADTRSAIQRVPHVRYCVCPEAEDSCPSSDIVLLYTVDTLWKLLVVTFSLVDGTGMQHSCRLGSVYEI